MFSDNPSVTSAQCENIAVKPSLAVVGAGLAGLSAAWLLKDQYNVTLFERHERAGMGVFTTDYHSNGISTRIDIPLRIFTKGYYPQLFALYRHLGVEMEDSDHASVFHTYCANSQAVKPFFQYRNAYLGKTNFSYLSRNSLNISAIKLVVAQFKFFKKAQSDMKENSQALSQITFGDYLNQNKFNHKFLYSMLLPALAVTCTCDFQGILNYPADLILGYLTCGVMSDGIVRAKQGVDGIVPKLTQGFNVLCSEEVQKIKQDAGAAAFTLVSKNIKDQHVSQQNFEKIIIATQADIAQKILSAGDGIQQQQAQLLDQIDMQSSSMLLHTDNSLVYNQNRAAPVSYLVDEAFTQSSTSVDLSKAFSTYQSQQPVFQTWNALKTPKADSIITEQTFTRPLVTLQSRKAVEALQQINKTSDIKICGSYMANKIPLLDAAVESSVGIAKLLHCDIPWEKPLKKSSHSNSGSGINVSKCHVINSEG